MNLQLFFTKVKVCLNCMLVRQKTTVTKYNRDQAGADREKFDARGPRDIVYSGNMGAIASSLRNRQQKG